MLPLKAGEKALLREAVLNGHQDASTEINFMEVGGLHTQSFDILNRY
jgi:hypothetical protein